MISLHAFYFLCVYNIVIHCRDCCSHFPFLIISSLHIPWPFVHIAIWNIYILTNSLYSSSRLVDAFKEQIATAVEDSVSKRIQEGILKLDSLLQSIPKEIPVDRVAALNVTFVKDPVSSNSSIDFEINGLFTSKDGIPASNNYQKEHRAPVSCRGPAKMIEISLDENVFNSAASVYYRVSS